MAKRKYILLLILTGISVMYLAGCGSSSGSLENPMEKAAVSDMDNIEGGATEEGMDAAMLSEENQGGAEGNSESEEGVKSKEVAESGEGPESKKETESEEGVESKEGPESEQKPGTENGLDLEESESEGDDTYREVPKLPGTGRKLEDFAPDGWEVLDSAELDFNEDGIPDYVGVLEAVWTDAEEGWFYQDSPRILFAIASDGEDGYRLDFQDINLIRTRGEGGVFGDPYNSLTVEGTSFTTHAYGGSAWRWSEDNTYTYRKGVWWLTLSEETYGYGDYITNYSVDDWDRGAGIRKKRSSEFSDMEDNWESEEYDVVYELALDDMLTLEQAGKRWWLAPERVTDWEVEKIEFAQDIELSESMVKLPGDAYVNYCDEDCVLYTFSVNPDTDEGFYCLALYRLQDKVLSVLAKDEAAIDYPEVYKGKIYYSADIVEKVSYREMQDGAEQVTEEEDRVGVRLIRMNLDGTGKETVFEYRYSENTNEIMDRRIPYLSLIYEISGDEIVVEVYIGNEPHPFYRMNTDGSEKKEIGRMPKG